MYRFMTLCVFRGRDNKVNNSFRGPVSGHFALCLEKKSTSVGLTDIGSVFTDALRGSAILEKAEGKT
jgi:hypothetical protein